MTRAETIYEKNGSLSELEKRLECHGFCRIHKSYLVNMMYVDKMECYKVHMENGNRASHTEGKVSEGQRELF